MNYFAKQDVTEINVHGVNLKVKNLSHGENAKATNLAVKIGLNNKPSIDSMLLVTMKTIYSIVEWDLKDETGKVVPISVDTFNMLSVEFADALISAVQEASSNEVSDEEKKN